MSQEILKPNLEQAVNSVSSVEQVLTAENQAETVVEKKSEDEVVNIDPAITAANPVSVQSQPVIQLTPRQEEIDDILEDGLGEIYVTLTPEKQAELRRVGGETVRQIDQLLDHAKSQINKIIGLIRKFLLVIPGVNRFFLEQEVKIKADKIISLKDQ